VAQARIWAASDADALARGWHIVELHGGWSRQYRDPRLAELLAARRAAAHRPTARQRFDGHPPRGGQS